MSSDAVTSDAVTSPRRVLVLVGTDHHPFDRVVGWADAWATSHPEVEVVVQYGRSRAPEVAEGQAFLDHARLTELMAASDAVVSHGGPATISEARAAGHRPIVVPRDPSFGEHVDDHQMRFSAWLASKGLVDRHTDEETFGAALEVALVEGRLGAAGADAAVAASVERFARIVEGSRRGHRIRAEGGPVVVFLAGFGRSGSTLLERLLGETPGVTCLGEVAHLWERGLRDDQLCACGEPFGRCPTWQGIGERAFGGWGTVDVARVLELRGKVDRQRRIPATARPSHSARTRADLTEYAGYYSAIYRAAADLTGSAVVVDSSKQVSTAFALSHDADLDLRVLHLVRDPRAVAYSWSKEVERPEVTTEPMLMPQYSAATSGRRWLTSNLLVEALRVRGVPLARLQYEQLVRDPLATLQAAARSLDLPVTPALEVVDGEVVLGTSHSVAGNPMRFVTGPIRLRLDDAWAEAMPTVQRRLVGGLTSPLAAWYRRG